MSRGIPMKHEDYEPTTLDDALVAAFELDDGKSDQIFFDDKLTGFGFRLRTDGGRLRRSWIAQYRIEDGSQRRFKIGDADLLNAKRARKSAELKLLEAKHGDDPQAMREEARRAAKHTMTSVADDYLATKEAQVKEGKYRDSSLRVTRLYLTGEKYFGPLHSMPISKIGLADIATRLNAITRNNGSVTSGRARSALSSLFTWAMQNGLMGANPNNPVIGTKKPADAISRDRVLKDAEIAVIWRACGDDDFGRIVKLLILTACRRDEIGGLCWSEINLDEGALTLPKERVKNNHAHKLPLTELALSIIRNVPQVVGRDHLFGDRSGVGFTKWSADKADLDDRLGADVAEWRLHDLRRTVATWMAEHGDVEPHIIEAVLNHYSGHRSGVAGTYNRARYDRQIGAALALWTDHVLAVVEGGGHKLVPFPKIAHEAA